MERAPFHAQVVDTEIIDQDEEYVSVSREPRCINCSRVLRVTLRGDVRLVSTDSRRAVLICTGDIGEKRARQDRTDETRIGHGRCRSCPAVVHGVSFFIVEEAVVGRIRTEWWSRVP